MARTGTVSKGAYTSALGTNVTSITVQNMGPGVAAIVLSTSAPADSPGDSGFELQAGQMIPLIGLAGDQELYVGAVSDSVDVEYLTAS